MVSDCSRRSICAVWSIKPNAAKSGGTCAVAPQAANATHRVIDIAPGDGRCLKVHGTKIQDAANSRSAIAAVAAVRTSDTIASVTPGGTIAAIS